MQLLFRCFWTIDHALILAFAAKRFGFGWYHMDPILGRPSGTVEPHGRVPVTSEALSSWPQIAAFRHMVGFWTKKKWGFDGKIEYRWIVVVGSQLALMGFDSNWRNPCLPGTNTTTHGFSCASIWFWVSNDAKELTSRGAWTRPRIGGFPDV